MKDMDMDMGGKRNKTYLQDFGGAIPTILSIMAGVINMSDYVDGTSSTKWQTAYMTELAWSGVIESAAITLVFVTDSDLLRAIGAWSMVGVNATILYLINDAQNASSSDNYTTVMILHGIALGMSIVTWGQTYFVDSCGNFKYGGAAADCKAMKDKMKGDWDIMEMEGKEGMMGADGETDTPSGDGGPPEG